MPIPPAERGTRAPTVAKEASGGRPFLVGAALFAGARLVSAGLDRPLQRLALWSVVLGAFALSARLGRALPRVLLAALAVAAGAWGYGQREALRAGRVSAPQAIEGVLVEATGLGAGLADSAVADALLGGARYARYLDKIDTRSSEINILASHLASPCESADHLCETVYVLRFVADEVAYRNDPEGPDYVKTPQETLAANAGDCEDKTILTISLLGSLGIHTYMAFTPTHAFPYACFEQPIWDDWMDRMRGRGREWASRYARTLSPHDDEEEFRRLVDKAEAVEIDGRTCYPLEPTAAGSWLGFPHDDEPNRVLVDPVTRRLLRLGPTAAAH